MPWVSVVVIVADAALRVWMALRLFGGSASASARLTWLIVLVLTPVPFVPTFLYMLVGETRLARRRAARYERRTYRVEAETVVRWLRRGLDWHGTAPVYASLQRLGVGMSGLPALRGNEVELLGTGGPVIDRIIEDIDGAKEHCHLVYYIWMPTGRGAACGEALIRAAGRGVTCRVVVDAVGSREFLRSDLCARMKRAGVTVVGALPVSLWRLPLARVDLRNHRKIAVIDSRVAYCGSQNMTDETFRVRRRLRGGWANKPWIDSTVRVRGPAVGALQSVFLRDYLLDGEEDISDLGAFFPESCMTEAGSTVVQVLPSGPGHLPGMIHQAMLAMLFTAKEEIIMLTPYFVPDEATRAALQNAAWRGVDVQLVLPKKLDSALVAAASRSHYRALLDAGVRVWHHPQGLLHAKAASVDRALSVITSANFDQRSFGLNFECSLVVYDEAFTRELRFMQRHYLAESEEVTPKAWAARSRWETLRDNLAGLLGPLL